MNRDTILEQLNADDWSTVVAALAGKDPDTIKSELDVMFPDGENNGDLALAIERAMLYQWEERQVI